jgi:Na+/glutamate symporter
LYVPINARTQQLTPALLLQVLDSTHAATSVPAAAVPAAAAAAAAGVGAGCGGGSPVAGRQAEEAGQQHQQQQRQQQQQEQEQQQQQQEQGTPGLAAAVFPAPAKMVNFALVDGRDVVMMPVFDGLQPPAEGQQRH